MQKEVLIHVRGLQMMDSQGDQEPIEIVVPGQYYFRNGSHYLRYEELLDETAEPTINYIKMSEKGLEVSKKGLVNVHKQEQDGSARSHQMKEAPPPGSSLPKHSLPALLRF